MKEVNEITLSLKNYGSEKELWDDIRDQIRILTKNNRLVLIRCDEPGLGNYILEYEYNDPNWAKVVPVWLRDDEYVEKISGEKE
jgi:hypothetical protein